MVLMDAKSNNLLEMIYLYHNISIVLMFFPACIVMQYIKKAVAR